MRPSLARERTEALLSAGNGVLRLEPCWVARDFLPQGRRLGLPEDAYDLGDRGAICERWLGSTTRADNRVGPENEGLSEVRAPDGTAVLLKDLLDADPVAIMGAEYAAAHPGGLGRLAKIFDYAARLPFHVHLPQHYADLVGRKSKDESYYFPPGVDMGKHPESFLGVHPWLGEGKGADALLPYLVDWDSDLILRHSRAELQVAGEGFHIPSGVLHAPGTALTIELQEDSDVLSMFQALNAGRIISKELLFKDVRREDRERDGERFPLEFVDWELNGDPWFFENRHLTPRPVPADPARHRGDGRQSWIFYNSTKYNGKRLVVPPGGSAELVERGVYTVLVWSGRGSFGGHQVQGGDPQLDELLVAHDAAVKPLVAENTGTDDLDVLTFFGPGINDDVPMRAGA
ncbi:MAG: hypothetical protein GEU86_07190 [Actinophytocola sp.]|nr:hypothetical protein [Actinophytocola sp.]